MSTLVALVDGRDRLRVSDRRGLYYWASKLGSPGWGWFTGWFNLVGQIAVTAAIGYGLAIFGTALLNYWFEYPNTKEYVYLTYAVVPARRARAEPVQGHGARRCSTRSPPTGT